MSVTVEERLDKRAQHLSDMFKSARARLGDGSGDTRISIGLRSGRRIEKVLFFRQDNEGTNIDGVIFAIVGIDDAGDADVVRFLVDDVDSIDFSGIAVVPPAMREERRDLLVDALIAELYGRDDSGDQVQILVEACQAAETTTIGQVRSDPELLKAAEDAIDNAKEHGETWPDRLAGEDHDAEDTVSSLDANTMVAALERVYVLRRLRAIVDQSYKPYADPLKWENDVRTILKIALK